MNLTLRSLAVALGIVVFVPGCFRTNPAPTVFGGCWEDGAPTDYIIRTAANSIIGEFQPDLIVSDIGMPGTDGYQFIRDVRRRGVTVPAVALTAFARSEDRVRSIQAGFQAHLAKPVEPSELLTLVASLSGRMHASAQG